PSSMPAYPARRASSRHVSSVMSSPSVSRSSLVQPMGLTPIRTVTLASGSLAPPRLIVGLPCRSDLGPDGNLGHGDIPPRPPSGERPRGVGLDDHDGGAIGAARALEGALEVGDRLHLLGVGAKASRVRGEVDHRGLRPEEIVEGRATDGLLETIDA